MTAGLLFVMLVLLLSLVAGLARVMRGPSPADRMLAAQLFGTTAVALVMLMSHVLAMPRLLDVALVLSVLAAVAAVAFVSTAEAEHSDRDQVP